MGVRGPDICLMSPSGVSNHLHLGASGAHEFKRNKELGAYFSKVAKEKRVGDSEAARACNVSTSEVRAFYLEGLYKPRTLERMMDLLYQDQEDIEPYLKIKH